MPSASTWRPKSAAVALAALTSVAPLGCHRSQAAELRPERVFVSNEDDGSVGVLDAATGEFLSSIPVGKRPRGLRVGANGRFVYVALSGSPKAGPTQGGPTQPAREAEAPDRSADGIGVVDAATARLLRVLPSGADPEAFDVVGDSLFVSNEDAAKTSLISLKSGAIVQSFSVGAEPEGVTARPDGRVVYVTSEAAGEVTAIDTKDRLVLQRIAVGQRPRAVAFSADGRRAFVTNELSSSVSVIDAQAHRLLQTITLTAANDAAPLRPMGIVVAPDGAHAYVTTGRGRSVVELDLEAQRVSRSVNDVGPRPWGIGITHDGKRLYVANGPSNDVAVIDIAAWRILRRIPTGKSPWGVAIGPAALPR